MSEVCYSSPACVKDVSVEAFGEESKEFPHRRPTKETTIEA
jgi:hypothetical protein